MKNLKVLPFICLVLCAFLLTACSSQEEKPQSEVKEAAKTAEEPIEKIEEIATETEMSTKDQYIADAKAKVEAVDQKLADLEAKVEGVSPQVATMLAKPMEEVKGKKDVIHEQLGALDTATEETWEDAKTGFDNGLADFESAYEGAASLIK